MNNQPTTATSRTHDSDGGTSCQAEQCSLPPSLLPWTFEYGGVAFRLWLCHGHGHLLSSEQPADAGGEAA
jgi:hypothetical protein